jgi:hypothetical protein
LTVADDDRWAAQIGSLGCYEPPGLERIAVAVHRRLGPARLSEDTANFSWQTAAILVDRRLVSGSGGRLAGYVA